jgi:rubrerythrin
MADKPKPPVESLEATLETGIKREEESNRFYLDAASRAATPSQKRLLLRLADEELNHRENLIRLLQATRAQAEIDRAISGDCE